MSAVVVVATFYPKTGEHEAVRAIIAAATGKVQAEDGCETYALHEAPDRLVLVEKWASEQALEVHAGGATLATLVADVAPLLARDIDIVNLTPVPSGDPVRGVL